MGTTAPVPPVAKGRFGERKFVRLAIVGAVAGLFTFVLMQLLFGIGGLLFEVLGFLVFVAWLGSIAATVVGSSAQLLEGVDS